MPEIRACANLYSCKISNNTRQAALGIHIVNQHNVHTHTTPHLIIIILAEKRRVRDQQWPNPRMHCTSVSATSIRVFFFPLGTICHKADFTVKKKGMKAFPKDFSLCPVSRRASNTQKILISHRERKKSVFLVLNIINPALPIYTSA